MTGSQVMLQMEFWVFRILYTSVMRSAVITEFVWFILTRNEQVFIMLVILHVSLGAGLLDLKVINIDRSK